MNEEVEKDDERLKDLTSRIDRLEKRVDRLEAQIESGSTRLKNIEVEQGGARQP